MKSYFVAFATYAAHPAILPDDECAADALRERGVEVTGAVWDDASVDWSGFDAVVIRSTWDYFTKPALFLAWLDALERSQVRVLNPLPLMRWNADKIYLRALHQAGVRIVPTLWIDKGTHISIDGALREQSTLQNNSNSLAWSDVILKPTVSAGAYRTARFSIGEALAHQSLLDEITCDSHAMLQPFMHEIETHGELSFMFFHNGVRGTDSAAFSHCIRKMPKGGDFRIQEEYGGVNEQIQPSAGLLRQASHALQAALGLASRAAADSTLTHEWLYARVDGVETSAGLAIMEIECIEPSLFFLLDSASPARFADALHTRLRSWNGGMPTA
jgi:glutathione synthase/RimK-type ligase-like ATP-grasp enzyme